MHEHNNSFNRILTKLVTILTICFFPYLNPTRYLNGNLHFLCSELFRQKFLAFKTREVNFVLAVF